MQAKVVILAGLVLAAGGCAQGARNVDYPPQRSISSDIGATYQTNPTLLKRGQIESDEPFDAFPWRLDDRHQPVH